MYEENDIIRSDLWPTMSTEDLQKQLDILLSRMAGLGAVMGNLQNVQQYQSAYMAMQQACDYLSHCIAVPSQQRAPTESNSPNVS